MNKLFLFLLSLFLCSVSMPLLAQDANLVPAMVVQLTDGSKQVVELDYTQITDFSVLCSKGTLAVDVPEAKVTGVRSITFAMAFAKLIPPPGRIFLCPFVCFLPVFLVSLSLYLILLEKLPRTSDKIMSFYYLLHSSLNVPLCNTYLTVTNYL